MESLCLTCNHSHVISGQDDNPIVRCDAGYPFVVPFEVHECNRYRNTYVPTLFEMQQIAHILVVKKNKVVGFRPPKEKEDE